MKITTEDLKQMIIKYLEEGFDDDESKQEYIQYLNNLTEQGVIAEALQLRVI